MHEKRGFEALALLALAGLCAWLVRCLTNAQKTGTDSISTATRTISQAATEQMVGMTQAFSEVTKEVSGLAETLILGRDSPSQSENLPTNSNESENWKEPEIALEDLPEAAQWAMEEEALAQRTEMPWQSSTQPDVLD